LLAHGRWFSPGTSASSITKTGRHDIAESGVKHKKINQSINQSINQTWGELIYCPKNLREINIDLYIA